MDVSRFIREGDERDLHVFWRNFDERRCLKKFNRIAMNCVLYPSAKPKHGSRNLMKTKALLFNGTISKEVDKGSTGKFTTRMTLLVLAEAGGYEVEVGFTGDKPGKESTNLDMSSQIQDTATLRSSIADISDSAESLSQVAQWKTILTHCHEAGDEANKLTTELKLDEKLRSIIGLAMRIHDWGKSHPSFASGSYRVSPTRADLAKAPAEAWQPMQKLYYTPTHGYRRGFRHELASCLATWNCCVEPCLIIQRL